MMEKFNRASTRAYFKVKQKFEELLQKEDGLETVETVILVIVAIVIAATVVDVLTKGGDDGKGVIGKIATMITDKIKIAFKIEGE